MWPTLRGWLVESRDIEPIQEVSECVGAAQGHSEWDDGPDSRVFRQFQRGGVPGWLCLVVVDHVIVPLVSRPSSRSSWLFWCACRRRSRRDARYHCVVFDLALRSRHSTGLMIQVRRSTLSLFGDCCAMHRSADRGAFIGCRRSHWRRWCFCAASMRFASRFQDPLSNLLSAAERYVLFFRTMSDRER